MITRQDVLTVLNEPTIKQRADGIMELIERDEWISVEDDLPPDLSMVLCYDFDGPYKIRIYHNGWFNSDGNSTMNVYGQQEDITHWMLLPVPP